MTVNGFRFSKLQATLGLMLMAVLNVSGQEAAAPPPNGHQPTVPELQPRAEAGDSEAQYQFAVRYSSGHSVPHDGSEALKWFRKSAENGHAMGQVSLGLICREGNYGVKRDDAQAVDWFRKAANQGNAHGQSKLGFMYERGEGVPQMTVRRSDCTLWLLHKGLPSPSSTWPICMRMERGSLPIRKKLWSSTNPRPSVSQPHGTTSR